MNNIGPTVYEAARLRIEAINKQMIELSNERHACHKRAHEYANSTMLESERIATEAEKLLPELK